MTLLYTILSFILLVGVLIFVHELGHFLFAKLFDVKVLKFSLGFGPSAGGFRRGETEYCVAWVPLGGYVKMLGEDPSDEIRNEDQGRAFHQKPLWQRYIVVFAGPAFNIIFPTLIYLLFFAAQTRLLPPVVGRVFPGQPAAEAGLVPGDKIVAIDGRSVRYWYDENAAGGGLWSVTYNVARHPGRALRFTIEREGRNFDRFITPREHARPNRLGVMERYGLIGISPDFELPQVGISDPNSPAARGGLRTGDLITSVNGKPITRWVELVKLLSRNRGESLRLSYLRPSKAVSHFIDMRLLKPAMAIVVPESRHSPRGVSYTTGIESAEFFVESVERPSPAARIGVAPGDHIVALDGRPLAHWQQLVLALRQDHEAEHELTWVRYGGGQRSAKFKLGRTTYVDDFRIEHVRHIFGARNGTLRRSAEPVPIKGRMSYSIVESVRKTGDLVALLGMTIVHLVRGDISRDAIGGPVFLAHTARVAAEKGWVQFLWVMALISINLGIINLLPIPILDGGHIMFFTIEAVKRRPLSLRAREVASYVGLFLLVSLMVFALKNDIVRLWLK